MAYNNYYNPYNVQQPNIDRINRQIEDLQNLKNQMQNPPQIPVQNFINSQPQANQQNTNMYELKKLNDNDEVENIGILSDTIFLGTTKMQIKKMDGTIEKYNIVKYYPIDPKDQKINQLEEEIRKLKEMIGNEPKSNESATTIQASTEQGKLHNVDGKSTAKTTNK
jgi:polyhydroxyalkanoate synthesis regulator phasin